MAHSMLLGPSLGAQMTCRKQPPLACNFMGLGLMAAMAVCLQIAQTCNMVFLCTRLWFPGGNGTAHLNPVASLAWLTANLQLLAPLISLIIGTSNFCKPLLRTMPLLIFASTYTMMSYLFVFARISQHVNLFGLYNSEQSFRYQLGAVAAGGTVGYILMVHAWRKLLEVCEQRKVNVS